MSRIFIFQGQVIGKLTVLREYPSNLDLPDHVPLSYRYQGTVFECQCECGSLAYVPEKFLSRQTVKSCGCIRAAGLERGKARRENHTKIVKFREALKAARHERLVLISKGLPVSEEVGAKLRFYVKEIKKLGVKK